MLFLYVLAAPMRIYMVHKSLKVLKIGIQNEEDKI
jgi:hypothetical protein